MTARRIMGTEIEYGISVPGDPTANPVITSTQIVLAYAAAADMPRARRARWDYEVESPLRDARGFDLGPERGPAAGHRRPRRPRRRQRHPHQRRPALRRPRAPGVLRARGDHPARRRHLGQGGRAGHGGRRRARRHRPGHPAHPALQEQHRRQGRELRLARELPVRPPDAVPDDHHRPDAVLRVAPGRQRLRPRRARRVGRRGGLPALPARRLHRGRGRPGDHAQARHHQHPRRAARRRRQVPPPARHHRRRDAGRVLDVPQVRHRGARARR